MKLAECLVVSSHALTLKHKAKHGYITQKLLFQLLHKTNKQAFPGYYYKALCEKKPQTSPLILVVNSDRYTKLKTL